jgi:hypothetical protein
MAIFSAVVFCGASVTDILPRMSTRRHGFLADLFKLLVLCVIILYGAVGVTSPWAFHIGGRWTPLLYWSGYGKLVTKTGTYPLYVAFYPSAHFSRLHLDGLRPTGGLQGTGSLCTSPGVVEPLKLTGTVYGGWSSTNDALMEFRLLEIRVFNVGQRQGYFDLYGRWRGTVLAMDDHDRANGLFRSGLKVEHALITLDWGGFSDFKAVCNATVPSPHTRSDRQSKLIGA